MVDLRVLLVILEEEEVVVILEEAVEQTWETEKVEEVVALGQVLHGHKSQQQTQVRAI